MSARAHINIPFGTSLTQVATLPEGAESALTDPYAEKERPWKTYRFIALVIVMAQVFAGIGRHSIATSRLPNGLASCHASKERRRACA